MTAVYDPSASHCISAFDDTCRWYVIHCKSGKEKSTSEILRSSLELGVYLPKKKVWSKGSACFPPFFPGYFFIRVDLQKTPLSLIDTSPGVIRLLKSEGRPQEVPALFVETLCTEIARLNEVSSAPHLSFRPGDTLYVREGPLRGLESIFVGSTTPGKRVQVLLNFLGRLTKVEVEVSTVEKRIESIKPELVRHTRGKGRKIRHEASDKCQRD